ncbi:MAG: DNA mismatch repair endonuclease MutL [Thermodesulfovibrionales bacterium]|nr:DNA mismatch repair endonuclease MutL [Thermodesulfovibrionales bacterium]
MPEIRILPSNLRNKIAAGEVVERPASVVKELMENSIDAGASKIEIDIAKAGKRIIKVSDNGRGMDREDALLAFERYATSKIKNEDDLFNISTMGFRGEALASIVSVSKARLITAQKSEEKTEDKNIGACVEVIGGEIKETKDCSAIGTTIEIKDLFFNTPARRKFLKSDSTENYHIIDAVTREAISHYQIGFVLRMDGDDVLNLSSVTSYRERLVQVFGRELADGLIETAAEDIQMSIKAFLGNASNLRNNRNNQFLFINNRPVKDHSITYAVYKAYEELIPKDKHPIFFIFLAMDPRNVDFNVHPTKREVRFEDKSSVFDFVYRTAKEALRNGVTGYWSNGEITQNARYSETLMPQHANTSMISESPSMYEIMPQAGSIPFIYLTDTFIAIPERGGLALLDYHAAHERINYERLLKNIAMPSHKLLFPQQVKLQSSEYKLILDNIQVLDELGFEIEDFGHDTVIIRSLPEFLSGADLSALLSDVAASLISPAKIKDEDLELMHSVKKTIAAKLACHKSIRGKETPDGMKIAMLLKDLNTMENPNTCPHGRPTKIFISMNELRKMFKK